MADVEPLQLRERQVAGIALAVRPAIDRPVVKQDHPAIAGWRDIDLDHIRLGRDRSADRMDAIFEYLQLVLTGQHPHRGAVIPTDAGWIVEMMHAAMGDHLEIACRVGRPA